MKYFTAALFALASAATAVAQTASGPNAFNVPPGGYQTSAGSSLNISWTPTTTGTVSLYLRSGNAAYLNNGTAIASGLQNNGQYTWMVPDNIVRGSNYALEIVDDSDNSQFNFSPQFLIDSPILTASVSGLASTTLFTSTASMSAASSTTGMSSGSASGSTTASMSTGSMTSGSTTGSATTSGKSSATSNASGTSPAALNPTNAAPRATLMAGMLGAVAFGALAL